VAIVPPQPRLGDILVIDPEAGVNGRGALFSVDLLNGARSLISNFGMNAQGRLGTNPFGVALDASGNILVIDPGAAEGELSRVNPANGNRTVVSEFYPSSQGPLGEEPTGVAVDSSGSILVTDPFAGTSGRGVLFRVNAATAQRTVVSDFGDNAHGPLGADPFGVALEASGHILVIDLDAGTNLRGALFRVNPANGRRTIISDFGNNAQGPLGSNPTGVALGASGRILVIDQSAGTNFQGALFRVNPANGNRIVISDFGNNAQGPLGSNPTGVALGASGRILVIDREAGTNFSGALFGVNPSSGNRVLISDFGDSSKGILGLEPSGVIAFTVKCGGLHATKIGNAFDNTIIGTAGRDIIHGLGGNDTIHGLGGDDVLCGGTGDDTLRGGSGNDRLLGQAGRDTLRGGTGTDTCNGGAQSDTATGCETTLRVP
jgi:Ca2+-binding RTX toxin-like protein